MIRQTRFNEGFFLRGECIESQRSFRYAQPLLRTQPGQFVECLANAHASEYYSERAMARHAPALPPETRWVVMENPSCHPAHPNFL